MKLASIVTYSMVSLRHRQMRSWLTILGIVIGIAAVVSLLTIGQGFNEAIREQLSTLSANVLFITPTAGASGAAAFAPEMGLSSGKLYQKDVDRLKKIPEITDITRIMYGRASVGFRDNEITATVTGIEPGVFEKISPVGIGQGRMLDDDDRHVVVIGTTIAEETFGDDDQVGVNSYLIINGAKYRVVGLIEKAGTGFGPSARLDTGIFVHFEDARQMFVDIMAENEVAAIAALMQDGADADAVVERVELELDASHKVKEDERDYSVVNPSKVQESIGEVLGIVTVFLAAIASISLLVGGLAIANSMFTSVMERTHEIGVLKAVGANQHDILNIFLFESGLVGGVGGIAGTVIGILIVLIGSLAGLPARIDIGIAFFGIAFAFIVGMLSGYFPAKRAAAMSPVESLRYE